MPELTTTLYTAPGCGGCIATASALDRAGIAHHTVNTAEDTAAADYLRSLGALSAPAVVVTDQAGAVGHALDPLPPRQDHGARRSPARTPCGGRP